MVGSMPAAFLLVMDFYKRFNMSLVQKANCTYVRNLVDLLRWLLIVGVHARTRSSILRHVLLRAFISIQVEALRSVTADLVVEAATVLRGANAISRGTCLTTHVSALLNNCGSR